MNRHIKFVTAVMAVIFLLSLTTFAFAAGSVGVSVSAPATVSTGDTITYKLSSQGISGDYINYTVSLKYDNTMLSYVDSTVNSMPSGWTHFVGDNGSKVTALISDETTMNPSSDGFSISIRFNVIGTAVGENVDFTAKASVSGTVIENNEIGNVSGSSDTATVTLIAEAPTQSPTEVPATEAPATEAPATEAPATEAPATEAPTQAPTEVPATEAPTQAPTEVPATEAPTQAPTEAPATEAPTQAPTQAPTVKPTSEPEVEDDVEDDDVPKTGDTHWMLTMGALVAMIAAVATLLKVKLVRK